MIEELQIRVTPRTASCEEAIAHYIASERHMSMTRIQGVRIIKRSIDARQKNVMVNLKVRVYINEPDLGRIREGMPAQVYSDSFPEKSYPGWIGFISSTAEFTPKTVETTELRTKLVYQARIMVCNDEHELRLGMPVSVRIDPAAPVVSLSESPCQEQPAQQAR